MEGLSVGVYCYRCGYTGSSWKKHNNLTCCKLSKPVGVIGPDPSKMGVEEILGEIRGILGHIMVHPDDIGKRVISLRDYDRLQELTFKSDSNLS